MPSRNLVPILIGTVALFAPFTTPAQVLANPLFDDSTLQVINLTMDPVEWASLQEHYLEKIWFQADFSWNGMTVKNIAVRSHGSGSRSPVKPNLDLDFHRFYPNRRFLGLPAILIKANNEDPSNLKEWISMKLFRRMGVPAPREAPAQVFLNGQVLGLYFIVEDEDETFVQRNFGESSGYLYEFKDTEMYGFQNLGTDPSLYAPMLNLQTDQSSGDTQNFMNLVQVINRPSSATFTDDQFITALSAYLNPRRFLTYAAIESALDDRDGMCGGLDGMNNFDLYQFRNQKLYEIIPWDKDYTFGIPETDILHGITNGYNINLLAQRLAGIPEYKDFYFQALATATSTLGGADGWADREITREYNLIHSAAVNDPNKQCMAPPPVTGLTPCGAEEFEKTVQWLHHFLAARYQTVFSGLAAVGYVSKPSGPSISDGGVVVWGGARALSPNAVAVASGSNFGNKAAASALPLPRVLGKTFVAVEGVRAPLFAVSPDKVQFYVPGDVALGEASVVISQDGAVNPPVIMPVAATTPAIAAVVHANGLAVSQSDPLVPGEILVIYAVGMGAVTLNLPIDAAAPYDPPAVTAVTPQVSLGGIPASVIFAGLTPGYLGLYQVNVIVPADLPPNATSLPCVLTQNGQTSTWEYATY